MGTVQGPEKRAWRRREKSVQMVWYLRTEEQQIVALERAGAGRMGEGEGKLRGHGRGKKEVRASSKSGTGVDKTTDEELSRTSHSAE